MKKKIEDLFVELGFERVFIHEPLFYQGGCYHKVTFIRAFHSFVIETAMNEEAAFNRVFEDGDQYRLTDDEAGLLEEIRNDLINFCTI